MKKDNIEEIYKDLEGYSKTPPDALWENIEARLHPKKKKRRLIIFWGAAAALLVMFIGYMYTNSTKQHGLPVNTITDVEPTNTKDTLNKPVEQKISIVDGTVSGKSKEDTVSKQSKNSKGILNVFANENKSTDRNDILEQNEAIKNKGNNENVNETKEKSNVNSGYAQNNSKENKSKSNESLKPIDSLYFQTKKKSLINFEKEKMIVNKDSIAKIDDIASVDLTEELVADNELKNDSINMMTTGHVKWSLEILGGISNTASEASIQGTSVNTNSQNEFVYALKVGYAISERVVVKSGIGKNILGQEINNINYINSGIMPGVANVESIVNNESILFIGSPESVNDFTSTVDIVNEGTLQQQFDYIQVPLEFSYNVLQAQKFDISLGVGGNVNFLTNNRSYLDNEQIGESLGVDATIFGATLNSNLSYKLVKKTILFLEPSYNYFEKPIDNNNQSFNNTQLRVLFGLRYKF